jgi:3-oxoacyl-[acyl-carrier-protein] synthase III
MASSLPSSGGRANAACCARHDAHRPEQFRHALIIGADAFSKILDWEDRRTCVYFGDGAGAMLLSQTNVDDSRMHFRLGSDGRG